MALNGRAHRTGSRKDVSLTRQQIGTMIADGWTIIIVDGDVLRLDAWLKYHPGGEKTIMHMVGRDATDEVNAYGVPITSPARMLTLSLPKATLHRHSFAHG